METIATSLNKLLWNIVLILPMRNGNLLFVLLLFLLLPVLILPMRNGNPNG